MFRRQFVNLIVQNRITDIYSLRRIDAAKHLFYPSRKEAEAAMDEKKHTKILRRLADPIVSFDPSPTGVLFPGLEWFELFTPGKGEGRIVNSNMAGETAMFDADKSLLLTLPNLSQAKGINPVSFSITHPGDEEDSLYVMNRYPGVAVSQARPLPCNFKPPRSCFEVLEYRPLVNNEDKRWHWRLLPPPPFIHRPGFRPCFIKSFTTIKDAADGCTTICISSDEGTYCFGTACLDSAHRLGWRHLEEWRQVGAWLLPFDGRAEHVPELDIWLGFTAGRKPHHLCAVDLANMDPGQAPRLEHIWEEATLPNEKNWEPMLLKLINMGGNRFCIAKHFDDKGKQFVVLTGIELERPQDGNSLQIVQHKCIRQALKDLDLNWVL